MNSRTTMPRRGVLPALLTLALWAALTPACAHNHRPPQTTPQSTPRMKSPDVWTLIDTLPAQLPFTAQKIEAALSVTLGHDDKSESVNPYFSFHTAGGIALAEGVVIEKLDLRLRKESPHPGFLVLTLAGTCVTKAEVMRRYSGLNLTDYPRGRSLDEEAHFSRSEPWGTLSFGFAERARDCLRSVVFDPR